MNSMSKFSSRSPASLSRRQFFGLTLAGGCSLAIRPGAALALSLPTANPVVSFHADAPYLDLTGLEQPFHAQHRRDWGTGIDEEALLRLGAIT